MKIACILNINNGLSFLENNKSNEWEDIKNAVGLLNLNLIKEAFKQPGVVANGKEKSVFYLNALLSIILNTVNEEWPDTKAIIEGINNDSTPIGFSGSNNGVTIIPIGTDNANGGDFITNILLKVPYYFNSNLAEVSVLIAPSQETVSTLISKRIVPNQIKKVPTEVTCREQLAKFGPISSQAPAVVLFYSIDAEDIIIEDISSIKIETNPSIERTIEFEPEYYQAGVGLLSYFGEILRQKDPSTKAKVRIEQDGRIVRLHIESPTGNIETIEKELDQYALVISNQAAPETLFEQRMHIMQLESRLEVAKVELKNAHDLKQLTDGMYSYQIRDLREKIDSLTQQVATQILHPGKRIQLDMQSGTHEQL